MLAASSNFVYPVNPVVDIWKVTHPVEWLYWIDARADFEKAEWLICIRNPDLFQIIRHPLSV